MRAIDKAVNSTIKKLKIIADESAKYGNVEKELAALSTIALLKYKYNQEYTDDYIEEKVADLAKLLHSDKSKMSFGNRHTVLFYDGFGLDTRGLVQIYLNALVQLNYRVVYITAAQYKSEQPQVMQILHNKNAIIYNMKRTSYKNQMNSLKKILNTEDFGTAFFYTTPFDIAGAVAFCEIEGKCNRYLINLTDHAFWVGRNSVDYCIEFREYGASISHYNRGFDCKQLLELPYYPMIQKDIPFQGFPDALKGKKVIFSGGSLYKTIDNEKTYYRMVEHIVTNHSDVVFLYAGTGDDTYINELVRAYPTQVFFINERRDLYEVLKHSYLYLNTFPISGALMLQYAAVAMCLPITLRRPWDDDASGILMNEELLGETFIDEEKLMKEIDCLIIDETYRNKKRKILSNMVISEKEFTQRLCELIENPVSAYLNKDIKKVNTEKYKETYREAFRKEDLISGIIKRNNVVLFPYFPMMFISRLNYLFCQLKRKIVRDKSGK